MNKDSSKNSIKIPQTLIDEWNNKLEEISKTTNIPVAVILQLKNNEMEILITNQNEKNPYKPGFSFPIQGTYCEETIKSKSFVLIPDASKNPKWVESVNFKKGMVSYIGFPIRLPDGSIFGTICLNDFVPNENLIQYVDIIEELRDHIEMELRSIFK